MGDLRFALRQLRKSPGFAIAAILIIALGIAATSATFSVVNEVLIRPLPYPHSNDMVAIWDSYTNFPKLGLSPVEFEECARQTDLFDAVTRYRHVPQRFNLTGGGAPIEVETSPAESNLFAFLGATPAIGRAFAPGERGVVVLSDQLWREYFGSDRGIVGRAVRLDQGSFTVVGVMGPDFRFPAWAALWMPAAEAGDEVTNPVRHAFGVIGRLRQGASLRQVNARLQTISTRLEREHPQTSKGFESYATCLQADLTADRRPALLLLGGAVLLVLLIGCANVANLLLARGASRKNEIATRLALGATSGRLIRQLLIESLAIALPGGILGLAVARLATLFGAPVELDSSVILFGFGLSVATGILFGLAPAWQAIRPAVKITRFGPMRSSLLAGQIAITLALLAGAGLLARSFLNIIHTNPGIDAHGLLCVRTAPSQTAYPDEPTRKQLFDRVVARLQALPGVTSVAVTNLMPVSNDRGGTSRFSVPNSPGMPRETLPFAQFRTATPEYFTATGIPILSGRALNESDVTKDSVIVSADLARRFWPGEDAVGKRFITGPWGAKPVWSTIVGVAGNVKQFGLEAEASMDVYFPSYQPNYWLIRTKADPASLAAAVQREIRAADPDLPITDARTMDRVLEDSSSARRVVTGIISAFALAALLLASTGIYGVMSWSVAQRTRELGIRISVGATARDVAALVLADGLKLTFIGVAIGLAGSLVASRVISGLLYGIGPSDPVVFIVASVVLSLAAVFACIAPARRAMKLEPTIALRYE